MNAPAALSRPVDRAVDTSVDTSVDTAGAGAAVPRPPARHLRAVPGERDPRREHGSRPSRTTPPADDIVAALVECTDATEAATLRRRLVETFMPMATAVATRYRTRGESLEDLVQAACLGLVKAAKGFDPTRGSAFEAYAAVTITGEVRRHFRDHGWDLRPPRRIQELRGKVARANERLTASLGRAPRISEVAAHLGVDVDDVAECISSAQSYQLMSLDAPAGPGQDDSSPLSAHLATEDEDLRRLVDVLSLRGALAQLAARQRLIVELRYVHDLTQQEIGDRIGVSQMQVSRLLTKAHEDLRRILEDAPEEGAQQPAQQTGGVVAATR